MNKIILAITITLSIFLLASTAIACECQQADTQTGEITTITKTKPNTMPTGAVTAPMITSSIRIPQMSEPVLVYDLDKCNVTAVLSQKCTPKVAIKNTEQALEPGNYMIVTSNDKKQIELKEGQTQYVSLKNPPKITGAVQAESDMDGTTIGLIILAVISFGILGMQIVRHQRMTARQQTLKKYFKQTKRKAAKVKRKKAKNTKTKKKRKI